MRKNVALGLGSLPVLVIAFVWAFGGDEKEADQEQKRRPLSDPQATTRDYKAASPEERKKFCMRFVENWFNHPDDASSFELQNYLDRSAGLPTSNDKGTMAKASRGYRLWDAADAAARQLGW
ncbi:MAG: hypothetical protein ACYTGN_00560 [Planctomycetota bacterium]|jgi:hypothetical protein